MADMYNEFYGLKESPFNITPDPRFLFFSERHREAFSHLLFGIQQRKGFIQITGEVGWSPREPFEKGLRKTVQWYLDNEDWMESIEQRTYAGERLGSP